MQKGKPTIINDYKTVKDLPDIQIKGYEDIDVAKLMQQMFKQVKKTKRWVEHQFGKLTIVAEPLKEEVMSLKSIIDCVENIQRDA